MKSLRKNIIREFFSSPGRFIALLLIVILGAAVFSGMRSTAPSMRATADAYFARTNLADFRILSALGFSEDDIEALRKEPGVKAVMPLHFVDAYVEESHNTSVYSIRSLPDDISDKNLNYLNKVTLSSGRMPQNANECLADNWGTLSIGDVVNVADQNDPASLERFAARSFTVVGLAMSPTYISVDRGSTNIGVGIITSFLYVQESAFASSYYSEVAVQLNETANLSAFSKSYAEAIRVKSKELTAFGELRANLRYDEEKQKLDAAQIDYDTAQADALQQLADAEAAINTSQNLIQQGEADYVSAVNRMTNATASIANARIDIATKRSQLEALRITIAYGRQQADVQRTQLKVAKEDLQKLNDGLSLARSSLTALNAQIETGRSTFASMQSQMNALLPDPVTNASAIAVLQGQMDALAAQISTAESQAQALQSQIAAGEPQAQNAAIAVAEAEAWLADAERQFAEGDRTVREGEAQLLFADAGPNAAEAEVTSSFPKLAEAETSLEIEKRNLADGRVTYEQSKADAEYELSEAKTELDEAYEQFESIDTPQWYVLSREDNPGYTGFASDADRVANLSTTITLFLYFVAALVCLTTMTRMVEEQRLQIGTLKALGYSKRIIQFKYFFYAAFLGLSGGVIGVIVGLYVFPVVIWDAYAGLYSMGKLALSVSLPACITGLLAGPAAMIIATILACRNELKSSAAELLRPKAPMAGRRVLLERVGFLWRKLRFSHKVTIRNLFRYKKRFFTTVIGVAGCCALILTGLGLRDSIGGMLELQYGSVYHSSASVFLDSGSTSSENTPINEKLRSYGDFAYVNITEVVVENGKLNNKNLQTWLYVPEKPEELNDYISFRERTSGKAVQFPPPVTDIPSVVLTEKLAKVLDVRPGDTIDVTPANLTRQKVQVSGITENYIYNYIYITPEDYSKLFGKEAEYTALTLRPDKTDDASLTQLVTEIIRTDSVKYAESTMQVKSILADILDSLNSIIMIILSVSCGLALVVLYNLTNINIIERKRELATLKVLGFFRYEVSSYVNRESFTLCLIGIAFGLFGGVFLHHYVVSAIEVNEFMFSRHIKLISFVLAGLFPLLCSIVIHSFMKPRLRKIDPVTSLKSAE